MLILFFQTPTSCLPILPVELFETILFLFKLFSLLCCFKFSQIHALARVYFHTLLPSVDHLCLESHVHQFWKRCCNDIFDDFLLFSLSLVSFCYFEYSFPFLNFHAYFMCFVLLFFLGHSCGFMFYPFNFFSVSVFLLLISKSFYS